MIDNRSVEELLAFEPKNQRTELIGATMPCGAVVTNVYDAYEAGKKAGESLPKAPQDAYDAIQGASKKLVESISWYVWQNVIRQFKGELEDIRDLLKKLDDEKDFNSAVDERIARWAKNHLNEAMERADVIGTVFNDHSFDDAVKGLIEDKLDNDVLSNIVDEKLDEKLSDKFDELLEDWKFTEAVKEAVKELHFSVNVS